MGIMKKLTGWLKAADQDAVAPGERSVEPAAVVSQAAEEVVAESVSVPTPDQQAPPLAVSVTAEEVEPERVRPSSL